jgi:release factor glutamine methyltransferase
MRPSLVVRRGAEYLERHGVQSPLPSAETLLMHVLGVDRAGLYTRDEPLDPAEARAFGQALCRRCAGTPVQHLTGNAGFGRLTLAVRPGVFVPRPETEVLVEIALELLRPVPSPFVVDVGTGTGAIALSLVAARPDARTVAIDSSTDAVALAEHNAEALGLDLEVRLGDMLGPLEDRERGAVDLVVSNPPYVGDEELADAPAEVAADPSLALRGGPATYRRLFAHAWSALRPGGWVAVEIGETLAEEITGMARVAGWERVEVRADLNGRDRVVTARRPR